MSLHRAPDRIACVGALAAVLLLAGCSSPSAPAAATPSTPSGPAAVMVAPGSGKQVYALRCAGCHDTGMNGAPTAGQLRARLAGAPAGWQQIMTEHAVNGYLRMQPKGGFEDLSEDNVRAAAAYVLAAPRAPGQTSASTAAEGRAVYAYACAACHDTGMRGAPKLSSDAQWAGRAVAWPELLKSHASSGYITMAPRGGFRYVTDDEVAKAVDYMVSTLTGGAPVPGTGAPR